MYYTILGELNARFWQSDKLSISVRDMQVLGGFQSSSVVDRAKTVLGTENIVKIQKLKNRRTQYELVEPQFWLRNKNKSLEGQARDTLSTPAEQLRDAAFIKSTHNITYQKDEEDVKTPTPACEARGAGVSKGLSEEVKSHFIGFYGSMESNDEYTLSRYEKQYGTEKVKSAIDVAIANKPKKYPYLLSYIGGILTNKKEIVKEKGGMNYVGYGKNNRNGEDGKRNISPDNGITTDYNSVFDFDD